MTRALLTIGSALAAATLAACTSTAPGPPPVRPSPGESTPGAPVSPSLGLSSSPRPTAVVPTVASGPAALFAGQTLVYAAHGFSPAEAASITARVGAPVTRVFSTERQLVTPVAQVFIPVATMYADPDAYAAAAARPDLADELRFGVVLAASEADLRNVSVGDTLTFANNVRLRITAVVEDHVIGGYEMATGNPALRTAASQPATYLLVGGALALADVTGAVTAAVPTRRVRVETTTANGFLSGADRVLTQLQIKKRFGEFSIRQLRGGAVAPNAAWEQSRITERRIQQLGFVVCNRAVLGDLAAAMADVTRRGLGKTVHTADFQAEGGCYNPRVQRFADDARLSAHTWGIAVDINVDVNPLGARPRQDPRLVAIMTAHNFTWGGRWLRPDGAHFEWVGAGVRH